MFKYTVGSLTRAIVAERSKVNIGIVIILLDQPYLISIMTLASSVIENQLFKIISIKMHLGSLTLSFSMSMST